MPVKEPRGVYHKFDVRRRDTGATVLDCFVLSVHDKQVWPALLVWAQTVEADNPQLASDIRATVADAISESVNDDG